MQMGSVERLYLQHGENYLNLSAFDDVLRDISCSSDVTPSTLLKAKPFTLSYVNNIIVSVDIKLYICVYNVYYYLPMNTCSCSMTFPIVQADKQQLIIPQQIDTYIIHL